MRSRCKPARLQPTLAGAYHGVIPAVESVHRQLQIVPDLDRRLLATGNRAAAESDSC